MFRQDINNNKVQVCEFVYESSQCPYMCLHSTGTNTYAQAR